MSEENWKEKYFCVNCRRNARVKPHAHCSACLKLIKDLEREAFEEAPDDIKVGGRINPFWAFVVWNYDEKSLPQEKRLRIQILEITQKTIMFPIKALVDNAKWGNPKNYDITVIRKGTGLQGTEYTVMPNPHTPLDPAIYQIYENTRIDLEALYTGDDPFGGHYINFCGKTTKIAKFAS